MISRLASLPLSVGFQVRVLSGLSSFSPDLPGPRDQTCTLALAGGFFNTVTGMPIYRHISCFYCALYFIVLHRYCIFYKFNVCGSPTAKQEYQHHFQTAFAHFVPLSHFGNLRFFRGFY